MACKCKETALTAGKYSDNGESGLNVVTGIQRIPAFFNRIFLTVFVFLLVIVIMPFLLLYVFVNTAIGRETNINLRKILKPNAKRK